MRNNISNFEQAWSLFILFYFAPAELWSFVNTLHTVSKAILFLPHMGIFLLAMLLSRYFSKNMSKKAAVFLFYSSFCSFIFFDFVELFFEKVNSFKYLICTHYFSCFFQLVFSFSLFETKELQEQIKKSSITYIAYLFFLHFFQIFMYQGPGPNQLFNLFFYISFKFLFFFSFVPICISKLAQE